MLRIKKLQDVIKAKYNIAIGEKTAEDLQISIDKILGTRVKVAGRSYASGHKTSRSVTIRDLLPRP